MDEEAIKKAVLGAIEKSVDAHQIADVVRQYARGPRPTHPEIPHDSMPPPSPGAQKLLTRIVLGDILDDGILAARPSDPAFPLRLFFGELSRLLAADAHEPGGETISDHAFTLASGLNFFFRAPMDPEAKMRVGVEVSKQLYSLAHEASLDRHIVSKSPPLLAALMTNELERLKFESVDHIKVFDSALHERAPGSDPTSFAIARPASFLCRVAANNAVKVKAEVLT